MPSCVVDHARCGGQSDVSRLLERTVERLGSPPSAAFVLLPATLQPACLEALRVPFPVAHATTAGQFTAEGRCDDDVVVLAYAPGTALGTFAPDVRGEPARAIRELVGDFERGADDARRAGHPFSSTVLLTDGLATTGSQIVDGIRRRTRPHQIVVGGAAGDAGRFEATRVGLGATHSSTGAAAVHLFTGARVGVGVRHGLRPASERMLVTRADGARVLELDGEPAFEAYRRFAKERGVTLTEEDGAAFMIRNELGVFFFDELSHARAPLAVEAGGALRCAGPIEEGSSVCILDGTPDRMVEAAREAALEAKQSLRGEPGAVLVFDCVCRGLLLADGFEREVGAIAGVFPDVPLAGFLTYGEIARSGGRVQGWHNTTAVVLALPAA